MSRKVSFLFVCMGNICRSPILMAMLKKMAKDRKLSDKVSVDSCALMPTFLGSPIDLRMAEAAKGYNLIYDHRARLITDADFSAFDYILAVDHEVLYILKNLAKEKKVKGEIALATSFSKRFRDRDMHDPYYGGPEEFQKTVEMAEDVCEGIIASLAFG